MSERSAVSSAGERVKVLVGIPVLLIGGTERQTLQLVRALVDGGYAVTLCCYHEFLPAIADEFCAVGASVRTMELPRPRGAADLYGHLRRALGLYRAFREESPDLAYIQYLAPGLLPIILARLARVPQILSQVHQPGRQYPQRARWFMRAAAVMCDRVICVSRSVEEFWFGDSEIFHPGHLSSGRRHFTLYNGIDGRRISAVVDATDSASVARRFGASGHPVIGRVARLHWEKGHDVLLRAFKDVVRQAPDAQLMLVGGGDRAEELRVLAESLGVEKQVLWLGDVEPGEAIRLYSVMDVLAVSSLIEGFGLTILEAMAAGVPVVASSVDGPAEIVEHRRTGLLVRPGDSGALAAALLEAASKSEESAEWIRAGRALVEQDFSEQNWTLAVLAIVRCSTRGFDDRELQTNPSAPAAMITPPPTT